MKPIPKHISAFVRVTTESKDVKIARLKAVNADLLEALEAFLRAPALASSTSGTTILVQDFNLDKARAAIAKANGEI